MFLMETKGFNEGRIKALVVIVRAHWMPNWKHLKSPNQPLRTDRV
jgi:hypothetical protein